MRKLSVILSTLILTACGNNETRESGIIEVRVYGEDFIESSIPSDTFIDGWSVTFATFLIHVGDIAVQADDEAPVVRDATYRVFDLAQDSGGEGHLVLTATVEGGVYDHVAFTVSPANATSIAGNATPTDLLSMQDNGYSVFASGTATKGDVTLSFAWGFGTTTRYAECHVALDVDGNTVTTIPTIHADHLFYDDLFSEEPNVAFDLVAQANANEDDAISVDELAAINLATEERYQVGSTGITKLYDFIAYQTSTLGHIDGEGHCSTITRD